jgi:cardiolipin synthase
VVEVASGSSSASIDRPSVSHHSSRVVTVPNLVTLVRLCCIPLFLYLLFGLDNRAAAAWLLGGIGATDWVDGYIARRFGQVSDLGKILDPTADRLVFIVGVSAIIVDGSAPLFVAWAVVVREVLVGGAVAVATLAGMKRFDVTRPGKLATFLLMFAMPAFMLGSSDFPGHAAFEGVGWALGIPALALSWYTAARYAPMIRENLRAGRREQHDRAQEGWSR